MMASTLGSRTADGRQTEGCVDEAPAHCSAIDAVLDQAYLNDILQHMKSAYKLVMYGCPFHLVLAAVAAVAFWNGASRHVLISSAHPRFLPLKCL